MKFIVSKTKLLEALTQTGKCLARNVAKPILENYLFDIDNSQMSITGYNEEVSLTKTIPVDSEGLQAKIAVPPQRLTALLKELPEMPIEFHISLTPGAKTVKLTMIAGKGSYIVPAELGDDFPHIKPADGASFTLAGDALLDCIRKTAFACSTQLAVPQMNGLLMAFSSDKISCTGCDGNMLSTFSIKADTNHIGTYIVPARVLNLLEGIWPKGEISMSISANNVVFALDEHTVLKSLLIDGRYPAYQQIIPNKNPNALKIDRNLLLGSIKRVVMFGEDKSPIIKLSLSPNGVSLSSKNSYGELANEELEANYSGEAMELGLFGKSLQNCISRLGEDEAILTFSHPKAAVVLSEEEKEPGDTNNLMLTQPYMLDI